MTRNDLIRDIESHIEIIFECFDLDDSVVTTTTDCGSKPESSSAESSMEIVATDASVDEKKATDENNPKVEEAEKKSEVKSD